MLLILSQYISVQVVTNLVCVCIILYGMSQVGYYCAFRLIPVEYFYLDTVKYSENWLHQFKPKYVFTVSKYGKKNQDALILHAEVLI